MVSKITIFVVIFVIGQALSAQVNFLSDLSALSPNRNSNVKWDTFTLGTSQYPNSARHPLHLLDSAKTQTLKINGLLKETQTNRWFKAAIVPASLIVLGTVPVLSAKHCSLSKYTIHDKVLEAANGWTTTIDNQLQFVPGVAVFALKAFGVRSRSDALNQAIITAKAELLTNMIVHGMKNMIASERPNGGAHSMPSGHTAQAFLSATILDMEYRDTSPWISVSGYAAATTTGILRMVNNKHWISDVLIGAGIGIFSTKAVYFTHKYRWGKKGNMVILPAIYPDGGGGVSFAVML